MSHLGEYYACKIAGALHLALYRENGDEQDRLTSVRQLEKALSAWQDYARVAMKQYLPQVYARTRSTDLFAIEADVRKDIEIARQKRDKD